MRDGTWIDMQTPTGPVDRVKIMWIRITRTDEEIGVEQVWLGADEVVHRAAFLFDLEDCMACGPTVVGPLDVRPYQPSRVEKIYTARARRKAEDATVAQAISIRDVQVAEIIIDATCMLFSYLTREDLVTCAPDYNHCHHRHQAMLVMLLMTDMSPHTICTRVFNYRSVQPMMTARWKLSGDEGMVNACRKIRGLVEAKTGCSTRRSDLETWPELEPITK